MQLIERRIKEIQHHIEIILPPRTHSTLESSMTTANISIDTTVSRAIHFVLTVYCVAMLILLTYPLGIAKSETSKTLAKAPGTVA